MVVSEPISIEIVDSEIDNYGSEVVVRSKSFSYSNYGDAEETTGDATSIAVINVIEANSEYLKQGELNTGDMIFFFKHDEPNMVLGNSVIYSGEEFKINNIIKFPLGGSNYLYEVHGGKI